MATARATKKKTTKKKATPARKKKAPARKKKALAKKKAPARGSNARLTRPIQRMTAAVRAALTKHGVLAAYRARPPYQRNDYLGWIKQSVSPANQAKRIETMIHDLKDGGLYMAMKWPAGAKKKAARRS